MGDTTEERPDGGMPTDIALQLMRTMLERINELRLAELDADRAKLAGLDPLDEAYVRAKWSKIVDLSLAVSKTFEARYGDERGQLRLIEETYGEDLGLPSTLLPEDVEKRQGWYQRRLTKEFEQRFREVVDLHSVTSPIEQIFLLEWNYQNLTGALGLAVTPQYKLDADGLNYTVDFRITKPGTRLSICIELDGHDFHEKTREQVANDKRRERAIVALGHTMLRFSGSEVVRNPRACIREIVELAEAAIARGPLG